MKEFSVSTNVGLRHLRSAVAVARHLSFTAAADELGVAVSALSETIKQIEVDTGIILFDRRQRPMEITEFGRRFVEDARRILNQFEQTMRDMRDYGGLSRGRVRIASSPSMIHHLVNPAIKTFVTAYPDIEISVDECNAEKVSSQLANGEVEIGIHEKWGDSSLLYHTNLLRDRFGVACSFLNPLSQRELVTLADVLEQPIISLTSNTGIRSRLERMALPEKIWRAPLETSSPVVLMWMIWQNIGVSILPRLAVHIPVPEPIAFVRVSDLSVERDICLITRNKRSLSPAASAFSDAITDIARRKAR